MQTHESDIKGCVTACMDKNLFLMSEGYVQSFTFTVPGFLCYPYNYNITKGVPDPWKSKRQIQRGGLG